MVTVGIANSATQAYSYSGVPMFRNQNIKPNFLDDADIIYIKPEFEVQYKNKRLKINDLLVVRTGYPGTACVVPRKYENSQTFTTLIARPKKSVNSYFLCQYLNSDVGVKYFEATQIGGGQKNSGAGILNEMPVTLPQNINEAKEIADYFADLDHLITLHQKKCFEWKKSGFSSASISWEQRKFSELYVKSSEKNDGSIGMNRNITVATMQFKDDVKVSTTEYLKTYYTFNLGDIAFEGHQSKEFRFGRFVENDIGNGIVSHIFTVFRPIEEFDLQFWKYAINNERLMQQILSRSTKASTMMHDLVTDDFLNETFLVPSLNEQRQIGAYLCSFDHLITLHQRKLERLKRLKNSLINRCFTGEKITMSKLILYHGSPNRVIVPKFGFGEDRHDYGRGFYLTENLELAKEWAVCRPDETNGWVHKYELEMDGLNILDFQKYDVLSWLAELMKHRDAADSRRYKMLAQKFIEKYGIDTCGYDVITGWRANASYFYIAKEFVRDNIDIEILEELLSLGGLGIQFCIKSERAFAQLSEVEQDIMSVDYSEFNDRYNERDINARNKMRALVDSDANKVTHVFSTLFER